MSPTLTAQQWDALYATEAGVRGWPNEELVRFGGRHAHQLGNVLEVGCGNGANIGYLLNVGSFVCGLDHSVDALQMVASKYPPHLRSKTLDLKECDLREYDAWPVPNNFFDTVVDVMTSQHVPWREHYKFYKNCWKLIRPGGRLFVFHLDRMTQCQRVAEVVKSNDYQSVSLFPDVGLICMPDKFALCDVIKDAGFNKIELRGLARTYPSMDVASYAVIEAAAI